MPLRKEVRGWLVRGMTPIHVICCHILLLSLTKQEVSQFMKMGFHLSVASNRAGEAVREGIASRSEPRKHGSCELMANSLYVTLQM